VVGSVPAGLGAGRLARWWERGGDGGSRWRLSQRVRVRRAVFAVERGGDGADDDLGTGGGEGGDVFYDAAGVAGWEVGEQVGDLVVPVPFGEV
jgi:hypothetical protein